MRPIYEYRNIARGCSGTRASGAITDLLVENRRLRQVERAARAYYKLDEDKFGREEQWYKLRKALGDE